MICCVCLEKLKRDEELPVEYLISFSVEKWYLSVYIVCACR